MGVFYRTPHNRWALHLMRVGPISYHDLGLGLPGSGVLIRLAKHGLAEEAYRESTGVGGQPTIYYRLTEAGLEVAMLPLWTLSRTGECCEDAILGIEGDHAPHCPVGRAEDSSTGAALQVPVGSLPQGAPVDQGVAVG